MPFDLQANKGKAQELQALRGEFSSRLAEQDAILKSSKERNGEVETNLRKSEARCLDLEKSVKSSHEEAQKVR